MKFVCFQQRLFTLYFSLIIVTLLFAADVPAQSRRSANSKKSADKRTEKSSKDARKEKLAAKAKDTKKGRRDERTSSKDREREKASDKKIDAKRSAEARRAEEARRRAEEERRQAIIAEQRRREQAAREARARRLAFERGLRTETIANISKDNIDGEDLRIRRAAVDALGKHAGTVVVMEAQTGKVVTIVNQDWAIRNGFKPCSTIKLVTGVAGLTENVINDEGNINGSRTRMDLQDALAYSSNTYFQRVGSNLGNGKMISYARSMGLGETTGINAAGETAGRLPHGNRNARIYSHGDDFEVTPLQLAVLVSAISNGGKRVVPYIAKTRVENTNFRGRNRQSITVPQRDLRGVIPGMIGAAAYGTARKGVDASMGVAGKTGSCIAKGSWVGLFASVAPVENPKYSVVVITRGQGERGKYAAKIAGKIYSALRSQMARGTNHTELLAPVRPKLPLDTGTARTTDDEDMEEDDDTAVTENDLGDEGDVNTSRKPVRTLAVERPAEKKLVTKTVQSQPKFAPVVIEYRKDAEYTKDGSTRPRIVKNK